VRLYKFLREMPDGRCEGPFSGLTWPLPDGEQAGQEVAGAAISACRLEDLPYWMHDSLWVVELGGDLDVKPVKVEGTRARLLARVDLWHDGLPREFAADCAFRLRDSTAGALRAADQEAAAALIAQARSLDDLQAAAAAAARAVQAWEAEHLIGYVEDAAATALMAAAAGATQGTVAAAAALTGYIGAHASRHGAAWTSGSPLQGRERQAAERRKQVAWLLGRLEP
jgi:hypothetical protein